MGPVLFAFAIGGFVWALHAFGIINLNPSLLPGVIADKRLIRPQFRQDTFNTIFGATRQQLQKTSTGAERTMQATIGGPDQGTIQRSLGGGL